MMNANVETRGWTRTSEIIFGGLLVATGVILPMIFHMFSMGGPMFLPMHIPVIIGGLLLSPGVATMVGVVTPIMSSLLTGMPVVFPMLPIMIFELAAYGLIISLCRNKYHLNIFVSMIIGMLGGRIVAGLVVFVMGLFVEIDMSPIPYVIGAITTGVPGILIQLVFIPPIVMAIESAQGGRRRAN